jgi:hypothetical protein
MLNFNRLAAAAALLCTYPAFAADGAALSLLDPVPPRFAAAAVDAPLKIAAFKTLQPGGGDGSVELSGMNPEAAVPFYVRKDEIVTAAEVSFRYIVSPGALPANSQIKVLLNGALQKVVPIKSDETDAVKASVTLDPLQIAEYNRIEFKLVTNSSETCGGQGNSTVWVNIPGDGKLSLRTQPLRLRNDLALLPTPFIDTTTPAMTRLPVVLPENADSAFLDAAAAFASWAGAAADWRGVRFKVMHEAPAVESHYVVFATNDSKPAFLDLPKFTEPTLLVMDAPFSTFAKVLVVGAENAKSLKKAARALSEATLSLGGAGAAVGNLKDAKPRKPYDAPNWVDTTKPVYFRDLVEYEGQLTSEGMKPAPIHVNLKLPPDLFMVEHSAIPLELKYRFTKPEGNAYSMMRFRLNNQLVDSYQLKGSGGSSSEMFTSVPVINSVLDSLNSTMVPALVLNAKNSMTFDFQYGYSVDAGGAGSCRSVQFVSNQVEIDPSSKLDLRDFHHFTKLPDLNKFLTSGYPFSRMADLSDTAFVLPRKPTDSQIETLMQTAARISSFTGLAASRFTLHTQDDIENFRSRNVIFIGDIPEGLKDGRNLEIASLVEETKEHFKRAASEVTPDKDTERLPRALIVGYKSPYGAKLSAVALMANGPEAGEIMNDKLASPSSMGQVKGAVAILGKDGDASFEGEESYFVGELPWYKRLWFELAERPLLLLTIALLSCFILAGAAFSLLRRIMRSRVHAKAKK